MVQVSALVKLLFSYYCNVKVTKGIHQEYQTTAVRSKTDTYASHRTILQSSVCPSDGTNYTKKPDGFEAGGNNLNWMVVLPSSATGMQVRLISNGVVIDTISLVPGLNYGQSGGVLPGPQRMELISGNSVQMAATGGRCISAGCPDCIYNMNFQVVELKADTGAVGDCPYLACKKQVFAHYMVSLQYWLVYIRSKSLGWNRYHWTRTQRC